MIFEATAYERYLTIVYRSKLTAWNSETVILLPWVKFIEGMIVVTFLKETQIRSFGEIRLIIK